MVARYLAEGTLLERGRVCVTPQYFAFGERGWRNPRGLGLHMAHTTLYETAVCYARVLDTAWSIVLPATQTEDFFEGRGDRVSELRQMTGDIHPFMKKPCNAHFVFSNLVQHKVMFCGKTAAARKPILARLTQLWVGSESPQATAELGGIPVHLPFSPLFEGILENIGEIERGQFRKNNCKISP